MKPEDSQDKRSVVWMGKIPLGEEDKYRYPTEFDTQMMLYESKVLTEEEHDAMSEKEFSQWQKKAEEIVKEQMRESEWYGM